MKICDVCFTSSWNPCEEGYTKFAVSDGKGGFMVCGYCELQRAYEEVLRDLQVLQAKSNEGFEDVQS